jgi:hypothetical protein
VYISFIGGGGKPPTRSTTMTSASTTLRSYTQEAWFVNLAQDTQLEVGDMIDLEGYPAYDIEDFIGEYGEDAFKAGHYTLWEELTNSKGYPESAVSAFVDEFGISELESFTNAYMGRYYSEAAFAEEYYTENYNLSDLIDAGICIDWDETWENGLSHLYTMVGNYVFNSNY